MLNSRARSLAAIIALVLVVAGCGGDAKLDTPDSTPTHAPLAGVCVALGSSFAAGPGAGTFVEAVCFRGSASYSRLLAAELGLELIDASCGGATIENVVDTPQPRDAGEVPPQIDSVPEDAALITIKVGGNDVGYIASFYRCVSGCPPGLIDDLKSRDARFAALTDELVAMLELLRERAPDAQIVLVAYPKLIEDPSAICPPFSQGDAAFLFDLGERLQQAFVDATNRTGVTFVDAYTASTGHGICQPAEERWTEGSEPTPPGVTFHPNEQGMAAQADLILEALGY